MANPFPHKNLFLWGEKCLFFGEKTTTPKSSLSVLTVELAETRDLASSTQKKEALLSVGAVTARSKGGLIPANQNRAPRTAQIVQLDSARKVVAGKTSIPPSVSTKGIKHAIKQAQKASLGRIALLVTKTVSRSTPLSLVTFIAADYLYNKVTAPAGFPGFDNIAEGWRDEQHHAFSPGDYVPNMFDVGPIGPPPSRALLDSDDASIPLGIRYWGDFGVDPYTTPGTVGDNWPSTPIWLPNPVPAAAPSPAYQPQPNLLPRPARNPERNRRAQARGRHRNITITFRIRVGRGKLSASSSFTVKQDVPGGRTGVRDEKAKPANQFIYAVLKATANTLGETKEWIDIFAEAAGYDGRSSAPFDQGRHQTVNKAWWLFVDAGINNIDFDLLAVLVIENEIEDFVIGIAGQMSKFAARSLGLTVGPQTGLAL